MEEENQILRINGQRYKDKETQEEEYLNELVKIANSGMPVDGVENAMDYKFEDILRAIDLIRKITIEVLCYPIQTEKFSESNEGENFAFKDSIRLIKMQYEDGTIFYPVFTGDEAIKAATNLNTNITMKMSGKEFLDKMLEFAPAFESGEVSGVILNPFSENKTLIIPGKVLMRFLMVQEQTIRADEDISIGLTLDTGENIVDDQKGILDSAIEFFKKINKVESAYIAFMKRGKNGTISIFIYINADTSEPRILLHSLHERLMKEKPSHRIDYMINNEEVENMFKEAGIGPFYKK